LFEKTIETGGIVNIINSEGTDPAKPLLDNAQPQSEQVYQKPKRPSATPKSNSIVKPPYEKIINGVKGVVANGVFRPGATIAT
jgi:hypothetical protein